MRQYYVLVDEHFREKKQVQEYADLLNRSPKTLFNLFAAYGLLAAAGDPRTDRRRSPTAAAPHLQKCKGDRYALLGFEDTAAFSRFFKKDSGRKHHRLPQEEQTCGTHIPSPIRTRRGNRTEADRKGKRILSRQRE